VSEAKANYSGLG